MTRLILAIISLSGLPGALRVTIYVLVGTAVGLAIVVGRIANAASYLSEAPETCVNCHVMTNAYATWQRGSHGRVAVCNDCHVPHSNIVAKTVFKGMDGIKHSYVFIGRTEPQVLKLSESAAPVVQANCLRCHADLFAITRLAGPSERKCWACHTNIHGETPALSSSPNVLRPRLDDAGLIKLQHQGSKP